MQRKRKGFSRREQPKHKYRINRFIRAAEVRLVGDNIEQGVYDIRQAQKIADSMEMDLVEISPNADPPVCRVVDFNKFLYERKKKEKEIKAKAVKTVIKEIRFTPNTDEHDFEFKARNAERFLQEGSKVKAFVHFRGRSIVFKDRGEMLLLRFSQRLQEWGVPEQLPRMEGRRMFLFLVPKKTNKPKPKKDDGGGKSGKAKAKAEKAERDLEASAAEQEVDATVTQSNDGTEGGENVDSTEKAGVAKSSAGDKDAKTAEAEVEAQAQADMATEGTGKEDPQTEA